MSLSYQPNIYKWYKLLYGNLRQDNSVYTVSTSPILEDYKPSLYN